MLKLSKHHDKLLRDKLRTKHLTCYYYKESAGDYYFESDDIFDQEPESFHDCILKNSIIRAGVMIISQADLRRCYRDHHPRSELYDFIVNTLEDITLQL